MTTRIKQLRIWTRSLDPSRADLAITVEPERLTSPTTVRGRFMGPRCLYSTTVEVAYPLREVSREYGSNGIPNIISSVIIPEPSLWDPTSPFIYQGSVELWEKDQRYDVVTVSHGLRTVQLGPSGLRINGALLRLQGVDFTAGVSEEQARAWHERGINMLFASSNTVDSTQWDLADRFGFFVVMRIANKEELRAELNRAELFRKHPCCLAWVVCPEAVDQELAMMAAQTLSWPFLGHYLGIELHGAPSSDLPLDRFGFIVCKEPLLAKLSGSNLPKILIGKGRKAQSAVGIPENPNLLGWIEQ